MNFNGVYFEFSVYNYSHFANLYNKYESELAKILADDTIHNSLQNTDFKI